MREIITQLALSAGMLIFFDKENSKDLVNTLQKLIDLYLDEMNPKDKKRYLIYSATIFMNVEKYATELDTYSDLHLVYLQLLEFIDSKLSFIKHPDKVKLFNRALELVEELRPQTDNITIEADKALIFGDLIKNVIKKAG